MINNRSMPEKHVRGKKGEMEKVYIALFSCCVIRAVHLELVEDLSAAPF